MVEGKAPFPQNFPSVTSVIPENVWEQVAVFAIWEMLGLQSENVSSWLHCRARAGLGLDRKASEPRPWGLQPALSSVPWRSVPAVISV